ncbi:Crp/Fnr family transcriptional regulator [Candidatus Nomurabacteria bacterium]|jgi:CRP-like cAMP-binding protein|nr:Crp/Fnr family transcriptional regulator [Candidatus Saccharibacteria bacterium]MCA9313014.1 Crp/Fnr family transcriptional regulator [Candidatus Saccharibacteria bacterium]MCB9822180.1 Crp/Fnr family transcriptional regulator [Candidatus Nomurabacteria bacterium]MDQ5969524.1 family transcriptional regulator, global nitrogen regulator [Patescibacteria group bacterium]
MLADESVLQKLVDFFHSGTKLSYKKGESIVRAGDDPRGIYYIDQGFVKAYAITKYGEENLLIVRKDGDIFPLIWAFTGLHRDITYQAMSDTTLWRVARSDFLEFLKKNEHVMSVLLDMSIEAYRLHSERVMNLEYRTVRERVASFLLTHTERFGRKTSKGILLDAPIRRSDIAGSINATRETTSRELSYLSKHGYILLGVNDITVTDIDKLRELL